ncbi:hypothetical protein [Streptomyces sp. Inha503]|uniref:hypothetical protein n=1 Tax=Streptomyces sp. Inha503 TaxID=3383314 RepID=UPI00399FB84C
MSVQEALIRLRQYQERPAPTWSTASYGSSAAESTLAEIGRTLAAEVDRLRAPRAARDAEVLRKAAEAADCLTREGSPNVTTTLESAWYDGADAAVQLLHRMADEAGKVTRHAGEYRYCGADLGRDKYPYTCNRRIGHDGPCGPDRDGDAGEITQPADTTPLVVHWDRLVMPPTGEDDHTVITCTADDGRPVALFLTDEHRQALGEELLTPLGDEARELLAEIRRRGRAITVSQAHRWLNTRSVPRAHVRALLRRLAEHGDLTVREERGRRTYVVNDAGGDHR